MLDVRVRIFINFINMLYIFGLTKYCFEEVRDMKGILFWAAKLLSRLILYNKSLYDLNYGCDDGFRKVIDFP